VVLTFRRARASRLARGAQAIGAAFAVAVFTLFVGLTSAPAQEVESGGCTLTRHSFNCTSRIGPAGDPFVRLVPAPADDAAAKRSQERERRWVDRCRPTIAPDGYGVPRYTYALPGCEFGIGEN
jgi:hypothetical protein